MCVTEKGYLAAEIVIDAISTSAIYISGTANILCRITVDGKSAAISTGISCTPQEWNAKKGEVRNARDNGRLASFLAEVKDKYNSLLTTNGIITVEMLKAVLPFLASPTGQKELPLSLMAPRKSPLARGEAPLVGYSTETAIRSGVLHGTVVFTLAII